MANEGHSVLCYINELPDNLMEKVLMCLSLRDAIRTSILSRRWRFVWKKLPHLIFDDNFCKESIKTARSKLVAVNQVLRLHHGPITKFTLSLSSIKDCFEINQLITLVSKDGIKDFSLYIRKGKPYKLPSSMFSCAELEHLNLSLCLFQPQTGFQGFRKLVCLGLHRVFITGNILSRLISSCPLLERLTFTSSGLCDHIEMVAPNLRFLSLGCGFKSLYFKSTPKLLSAEIVLGYFSHKEAIEELIPTKLSGRLPVIEFLELDRFYALFTALKGSSPETLLSNLSHLKRLSLFDMSFFCELAVSSILVILIRCPNLEKLKIDLGMSSRRDNEVFREVGGLTNKLSLNCLREVELVRVAGLWSELDFIQLLLAKCPVLETVCITDPTFKNVEDKGRGFFMELTQFPRISPLAKFTYKGLD